MEQRKMANEQIIKNYLLGELPDEETEELEERLFIDDDLFQELQVVEMSMLDSYVRKTIAEDEIERFEKNYLVTLERRKRVVQSEIFHDAVKAMRPAPVMSAERETASWFKRLFGDFGFSLPAMQYAAVGLIAVMTLTLIWLVYDRQQKERELLLAQNQIAETEALLKEQLASREKELEDRLIQQRNDEAETLSALEAEIAQLRRQLEEVDRRRPSDLPKDKPLIATVFFPVARSIGASPPIKLTVANEMKALNLQIPVGKSAGDLFEVTVSKNSETILGLTNVKPRSFKGSRIVSVTVPTRLLKEGRYDILLRNEQNEDIRQAFIVER
jgi:hypothetical protein